MKENEVADDLREAILDWTMWWDRFYQSLAESDGLPQVKAWALIQYERIRKKQLALLRKALADAKKDAQGGPDLRKPIPDLSDAV